MLKSSIFKNRGCGSMAKVFFRRKLGEVSSGVARLPMDCQCNKSHNILG